MYLCFFYSLGCRIGGTHKDVSSFSQQLQSMGDTFFSLKEESRSTLQSKGLPTLMTAIPFDSSIKIQAQLSGVLVFFIFNWERKTSCSQTDLAVASLQQGRKIGHVEIQYA